jgi:hypothetical protein
MSDTKPKEQPPFPGFVELTQENWPAPGIWVFAWVTGPRGAEFAKSVIFGHRDGAIIYPWAVLVRPELVPKDFNIYIEAPK